MAGYISTGYMMPDENIFAIILQNTYLCCHCGYAKKEKKV